jgi:HK97 family phage prohead protease
LSAKKPAGGREVRSYALQIKATGDDGTVEGYGSVFGVRDNYDDVIAKGAFAASLKGAQGRRHDARHAVAARCERADRRLDRNGRGRKGLRIKGKLALDTTRGKEAHALLKMGALNGLSIGFVSKQWAYDRETEVRTLTEIDLWEVSLVTFPANEKARVTNVKAADELATPKDAERILRDAGFSKSDATAFVSRIMRMGEERRDSVDSTAKAMKAADRLAPFPQLLKGKS